MGTTLQVELRATASQAAIADIRERILGEHAKLRRMILEVDRLAAAFSAGESQYPQTLRERAGTLYRMLAEHVDREEVALSPVLARIDAWGPVRLEQMRLEHIGQRRALQQAMRDLNVEGRDLGQSIQSMCWEILHDMKREEHDILHPDLWRDSPIVVEFGG